MVGRGRLLWNKHKVCSCYVLLCVSFLSVCLSKCIICVLKPLSHATYASFIPCSYHSFYQTVNLIGQYVFLYKLCVCLFLLVSSNIITFEWPNL